MQIRGLAVFAIILVAVGLLVAASFFATKLIGDVGERSNYGTILRSQSFLWYYGLLVLAFLAATYLLLRPYIQSSAKLGFAALGAIPEGFYAALVLEGYPRELIRPSDLTLSILNLPGTVLYWCFTGDSWDRWATGLTDSPTRLIMLSIATTGCLNVLGWLGIIAGVRLAFRRSNPS